MRSERHDPGSTLRTRPTLLLRVRDWSDGAGWEEFHQLYRRLVYGRARRAGLSHEDAEDVAQEVFKRVAETIRDFDVTPERGSFRGWLMQLTRWRIADKRASLLRAPGAAAEAGGAAAARNDDTEPRTATIERLPSPEEDEDAWDREWEGYVMEAALDRLARRVRPQHFQVFELRVRQAWSVRRVAAELGVHPAAVYLIVHRLTRQLQAEVERLRLQMG